TMSLESALDEERLEILKLLEGHTYRAPRGSNSSNGSAVPGRTTSPAGARSPVRSMLDIGPVHRHASIAGTSVGITGPPSRSASSVHSLLDAPASPPPSSSLSK